ncbi:phosphotransferase family protein [Nesterenkonia aurantiaca]|uniref:phosphotransferase family protein n=1 Tax=Nesterenkonia aurantiaca TaxID=1436010 RepID=UPI003EE5B1F5
MTVLHLPPELITESGRTLRITRAWPVPDDTRLAIECEDGGQRRAGFWEHGAAQLQPVGSDPRLPELERLAASGTVVSHRAGKRAVVRRGEEFTKVVRRGRAAAILQGVNRADAFRHSFRTPEVLAQDESCVTFAGLPGTSLHEPALFAGAHWGLAWSEVLGAWTQAALMPTSGAGGPRSGNGGSAADPEIPRHGAAQETAVLRRWARLVATYLNPAEPLSALVEEVAAKLQQLPEAPLRPAHRDLHDKQLLWSPQAGPGLLDVDTACLADPALDLGNLRAHARLRVLQGLWQSHEAETVISAVDAAADRLAVPASTLAVYERAAVLRLGCVYAVRPGSRGVAALLRARAARSG